MFELKVKSARDPVPDLDRDASGETPHSADEALASFAGRPLAADPIASPDAFDESVLDALRADPGPVPMRLRARTAARSFLLTWNALPACFFTEIAVGGLLAASLTGFVLFNSLQPIPAQAAQPISGTPIVSGEPPVPLDILLRNPAPRAAILWSAPPRSGAGYASPRSTRSRSGAPRTSGRRGSRIRTILAG